MKELSVQRTADGQLALAGQVTLYGLTAARRQLDALLDDWPAPTLAVSLADLEVAGSAILALLLHLQRQAAAKGLALALQDPPAQLAQLARPVGVAALLGLEGGA